jgi:hypothetical protein
MHAGIYDYASDPAGESARPYRMRSNHPVGVWTPTRVSPGASRWSPSDWILGCRAIAPRDECPQKHGSSVPQLVEFAVVVIAMMEQLLLAYWMRCGGQNREAAYWLEVEESWDLTRRT